MNIVRAFALWLAIIPFAVVNGLLRERLLGRIMGGTGAHIVSGVLLSAIVFAWTASTITWIDWRPLTPYVFMGLSWLMLTIAFEFTFGRLVAMRSWPDLLAPYTFKGGDIWPLVLIVVAVSPPIAASLRHG